MSVLTTSESREENSHQSESDFGNPMICSLALFLTLATPRYTVACVLPDRKWLGITREGLVAEAVSGAVRLVSPPGISKGSVRLPEHGSARLDASGNIVTITKDGAASTYTWQNGWEILGPPNCDLVGARQIIYGDGEKISFVGPIYRITKPVPGAASPQGHSWNPMGVTERGELIGTCRTSQGLRLSLQPVSLTSRGLTTLPLPAGYEHGTVSARADTFLVGGVAIAGSISPDMIGAAAIYPPILQPWRPVRWEPQPVLLPLPTGIKSYTNWSLLPKGLFGGLLLGRLEYATDEAPYRAEVMAWSGGACVPLASLCRNFPQGYVIESLFDVHSKAGLLVRLIQPSTGYALFAVLTPIT